MNICSVVFGTCSITCQLEKWMSLMDGPYRTKKWNWMAHCPLPCYAANKKSDTSSLMAAFFCQYLFSVSWFRYFLRLTLVTWKLTSIAVIVIILLYHWLRLLLTIYIFLGSDNLTALWLWFFFPLHFFSAALFGTFSR